MGEFFNALVLFIWAVCRFIAIVLLKAAFGAWWLMIALGNLHQVWPAIPALGYWQVFTPAIFIGGFIALYAYQNNRAS